MRGWVPGWVGGLVGGCHWVALRGDRNETLFAVQWSHRGENLSVSLHSIPLELIRAPPLPLFVHPTLPLSPLPPVSPSISIPCTLTILAIPPGPSPKPASAAKATPTPPAKVRRAPQLNGQ